MTESCGDTFHATIVEGYDTTVAQWQLYLPLTLLASYFTCYTSVHFVSQPVFTGYSFQLQHTIDVFVKFILCISNIIIITFYCFVYHVCLRRMTQHLSHIEVERFDSVPLYTCAVGITCCFTYNIQRGAFTFCYFTNMFDMFLINKKSHTFLTLVGDYLF